MLIITFWLIIDYLYIHTIIIRCIFTLWKGLVDTLALSFSSGAHGTVWICPMVFLWTFIFNESILGVSAKIGGLLFLYWITGRSIIIIARQCLTVLWCQINLLHNRSSCLFLRLKNGATIAGVIVLSHGAHYFISFVVQLLSHQIVCSRRLPFHDAWWTVLHIVECLLLGLKWILRYSLYIKRHLVLLFFFFVCILSGPWVLNQISIAKHFVTAESNRRHRISTTRKYLITLLLILNSWLVPRWSR